MCDTAVYVCDDKVFFLKNSDREVDEPQVLVWQPRQNHLEGDLLKCTYITIPQVRETYAILISKPTWMWGAEMGTNELGVTIGNEAVFTNQPYAKTGLTGMDLLRLALERAATAKQAYETIVQLIEIYGQGGNCGFRKNIYYHNSFIIADPYEAYVLETADKYYAVEKVTGCRAISNGLTIKGFKEKYSDPFKSFFTQCSIRRSIVEEHIRNNPTIMGMISASRLHASGLQEPKYHWLYGGMNAPCMHAGGILLNYQTTAAWVAELSPNHCRHWVTATSTPCISLFKPVDVLNPLKPDFCSSSFELNKNFWWQHETFSRFALKNPAQTFPCFIEERNKIENEWSKTTPDPNTSFNIHKQLLQKWSQEITQLKLKDIRPIWTKLFWNYQKKRNS